MEPSLEGVEGKQTNPASDRFRVVCKGGAAGPTKDPEDHKSNFVTFAVSAVVYAALLLTI